MFSSMADGPRNNQEIPIRSLRSSASPRKWRVSYSTNAAEAASVLFVRGWHGCHEVQVVTQSVLHFLARHDRIDQSMVQKKLGRLKAGRKFGLGRIFDHARAGEPDHRSRFGK